MRTGTHLQGRVSPAVRRPGFFQTAGPRPRAAAPGKQGEVRAGLPALPCEEIDRSDSGRRPAPPGTV
ncbi:hypothetical protein KCH_59130 [Kitasatospora cheerisanensis KCTC 2395]|uniref:Uncharacterized protein n=1 Tax=Kitasatospora cheerisanensis KCTC 2395 TaxID=1348663 RepID=A0A066YWC4_9ACTN|nr:hypothetical protein KCH_59130 [Kitasatospora cheerisanensis KCTC 2395]